MVGGGRGAFIGAVHRMAMRLDDEIELVAGAFSSRPEESRLAGEELFVRPERIYPDYETMAREEARRAADDRIDFVSVVTPNHLHFPICSTFLKAGFNVICEKPLALNLAEAVRLRETVRESKKVFVLTHNYTGYPMVKEARSLIRSGNLGEIQKVVAEYSQGWLSWPIERDGQKQAAWRTDPDQAGIAGCLGDIGIHVQNLVHYLTGLEIEELCAEMTTFVPGRRLDDDANLLLRYRGGAKGVIATSQVCVGKENSLTIRIYGRKGSLEWNQEAPNQLPVNLSGQAWTELRPGNEGLSPQLQHISRLPAGHPEGFIEAFANLYREAARAIRAEVNRDSIPRDCDFPTIDDGVRGMAFLEAAVRSAKAGGVWTRPVSGD
jgi:predicted dehydrogenase